MPTVLLSTVKLLEVYHNPKMLNKSDRRDRIFNSKFHSTLSSVMKSQECPTPSPQDGNPSLHNVPMLYTPELSQISDWLFQAHRIQSAVTQNTTAKLAIRLH